MSMIDPHQLFEWCRIPVDALENHPEAKVRIKILDSPDDVHRWTARDMADEVKANNAAGRPTRWILPCGPTRQYPYFVQHVNEEQISLRRVHVFHMDDCLDWEGRHVPLDHPFSYQGWMRRHFYDPVDPELAVPEGQRHFPSVYDIDAISRIISAWNDALRVIFILLSLIVISLPFAFLFLNSVKPPNEFLSIPIKVIPSRITLEHYRWVFNKNEDTLKYFTNSVVITSATTVLSLLLGSLAAYSLSRLTLPFRLTTIIAFLFLAVRFYPKITVALPYFVLMRNLHLLDTRSAVIIAHVSLTLPFVIWLMLTFFDDLPKELEQSAMLDGCNPWQRFTKVILPLTTPALVAAAILTALLSWNEFLMAATVAPANAKTLPVRVSAFITDKGIQWGPMSAMSSVIVIPPMIFALFAQRYLVRGLTLGAVKG
jgi:multiple sugar transport system permease protein